MNERIHELALEVCRSSPNMRLDIDDMMLLAKVIVLECASLVKNVPVAGVTSRGCGDIILEHFGVEE